MLRAHHLLLPVVGSLLVSFAACGGTADDAPGALGDDAGDGEVAAATDAGSDTATPADATVTDATTVDDAAADAIVADDAAPDGADAATDVATDAGDVNVPDSGFGGGAGTTGNPYLIYDVTQLDNVRNHLDASYRLMADLSLTGVAFAPIGTSAAPFKGNFDGNHKTIDGLTLTNAAADDVGLFGAASYATHITDLTLTNASVTGHDNVGILAGSSHGAVNGVHVTGTVTGHAKVGGLLGRADSGNTYDELHDDVADVTVTGDTTVGGLVGEISSASVALRCRSTGNVTGATYVGGLAGAARCSTSSERCVYESQASGNVVGQSYVGGLVGQTSGAASIERSFATGAVTSSGAGQFVGGLIGDNAILVANDYATGNVTGVDAVGGLIGRNASLVAHVFSSGKVTATTNAGGLVGKVQSTPLTAVVDGYWDADTSTLGASAGGTGKSTAEMKTAATFGTWDDATVWSFAGSYPTFRATPKACVTGAGGFDGGDGSAGNPYLIASAASFYNIRCNLSSSFKLANDIDFGGKANVPPVGSLFYKGGLAGAFDGNHKKLSNWTYFGGSAGIFGLIASGAGVKDVTVENAIVGGSYNVGTLAGGAYAPISGARATGGSVRAMYVAGGLVGQVGGDISRSMADVPVTASSSYVGGLVGFHNAPSKITDSYAWGPTTGPYVGSFASAGGGAVSRCYGKGLVTGGGDGFGSTYGSVTDSYWDITTTGKATSSTATGKTDAEMKTQATFVGWDFTNVWQMGASGYPELR